MKKGEVHVEIGEVQMDYSIYLPENMGEAMEKYGEEACYGLVCLGVRLGFQTDTEDRLLNDETQDDILKAYGEGWFPVAISDAERLLAQYNNLEEKDKRYFESRLIEIVRRNQEKKQ